MCAIAGWIVPRESLVDASNLERMLRAMHHRGPDDTGTFVDPEHGVALGHNRLSIIDLTAGGHQPMVNQRTGDVLTFNGEIYNFREIRRRLEREGAQFRSQSDSEVLLMAFERWGEACLDRLRGMYAFAIWRQAERKLYVARDPMGIKPLYYRSGPGGVGVAFASELRGLLAFSANKPEIDAHAVSQFLEFGYTFEDERTIVQGVRKLPPGHLLVVSNDGAAIQRRFFVPGRGRYGSVKSADLEEELRAGLEEVVRQHLVADVPVGLLLSGGIDSSIIAAIAVRHAQVRTFTMGFAQSRFDERQQAQVVADHLHTEHAEIVISPEAISGGLDETIACFDDLFADWGTISTRLLYRECHQRGIKVVLVGEGADELFGGYDIFRMSQSRIPTELWLFQLYRRYAGRRYGSNFPAFRAVMQRYLRDVDGDRFAAIRLFETQNQLPNNYVMKVDKASMSVSVEARVPFLDQRIAEIAYACPSGSLLASGSEKKLLRDMARRYNLLPEPVLNRRKLGGSIAASWMDDHAPFRRYAEEIILADGTWTAALGHDRAMRDYFRRGRSGYSFPRSLSIFSNLAWRLLILELWSAALGMKAHVH